MSDAPTAAAVHPVPWGAVLGVAAAVAAALVVTSNRYGFHRDELYFMEAGRHLDWGYIDQPVLTPLIGRVATEIFGASPAGLRAPSAVAIAASVVLSALIARELGGERRGQFLAAGLTAISAVALAVGHLLSTTTFDLLAWLAVSWFAVRALAGDRRSWIFAGIAAGIGLQNKHLVVFLLVALLGGLIVDRRWTVLRDPWVWAGAGIALALWLPNLLWQVDHGWPQLDMANAIAEDDGGENRALLLPLQLILLGPLLLPIWVSGLAWLFRSDAARPWRPVAWAYPILFVLLLATGGKGYYTAGLLVVYLAAGAVVVDRWMTGRRGRQILIASVVVVSAVTSAYLALPLQPVESVGDSPVAEINEDAIETIGWPGFVDQVSGVVDQLPEDERRTVTILTGNYGEAGAIDRYGPDLGLPRAYSAHNSYADWGIPVEDGGPVVVVGYWDEDRLAAVFEGCRRAATIDNGVDVENEEQGAPVWLCEQPVRPWAELWPQLRHLS